MGLATATKRMISCVEGSQQSYLNMDVDHLSFYRMSSNDTKEVGSGVAAMATADGDGDGDDDDERIFPPFLAGERSLNCST